MRSQDDDSLLSHAEKNLAAGLARSASKRDIREPREVYDDERRAAAIVSLKVFLESYFPQAFPLPWSTDHIRLIETLQRAIDIGGMLAVAMPRGSGKTSIATRAALWAILTGRRRYVEIITGTEAASRKIVKVFKSELTNNDQLRLDFPGEMHGLWQLQGDNRKSGGQLCHGEKTNVVLGTAEIVFPTHKYTPIGGSVVYAAGITGNIRGPSHTRVDGSIARPDFVLLDDPQTRESSKSVLQTQQRMETIEGDVLGLAGPGQDLAVVVTCTVITKNDLAERILTHPRWSSIRSKTLLSFPANMAMWDQCIAVRDEGVRTQGTTDAGDAFLRANWDAMHAGAEVYWEHRKQPSELSAVQSAMHLYYQSPEAFAAEYQNEPEGEKSLLDAPTFAGLESHVTGLKSGVAPLWATKLTAGIDVQKRGLYYLVAAWDDHFRGSIVGYGAWPQQSRAFFSSDELNPTLQQASASADDAGAWYWGLTSLVEQLAGRQWLAENGAQLSIGKIVVDANYGDSTDTVYEFCRRTHYRSIVVPSHGRGLRAGDKPMDQWGKKEGETHGFHWVQTSGGTHRGVRHLIHDVNFWKTFLANRAGQPDQLSICGTAQEEHRLLAHHLGQEHCTYTTGRGREVWEWRMKPGSRENHLLDCFVMAAVGASMLGSAPANMIQPQQNKRRTFSLPGARA